MYDYKIPGDIYDLIISVSSIHHGKKDEIKDLIGGIHDSLLQRGKIFVTLPDISSVKKWDTFKHRKKIAKDTFCPMTGPEKGLIHSFYSQEEIRNMFSRFSNLEMDEIGRWVIRASR